MRPALEARAGDTRHLGLVRDKARASVAAFVRRWLLQRHDLPAGAAIQVRFADEVQEPDAAP